MINDIFLPILQQPEIYISPDIALSLEPDTLLYTADPKRSYKKISPCGIAPLSQSSITLTGLLTKRPGLMGTRKGTPYP